jgi:hypothetical protein
MPINQVVALLPDCILSFDLAKGATLADLANRLDHLGEGHVGMPTAMNLTMGVAQQSMSVLQPRTRFDQSISIVPPNGAARQ